jgi:hypothetical protein
MGPKNHINLRLVKASLKNYLNISLLRGDLAVRVGMQVKRSDKLTARDFVYVNDEVIGRSYQNGPYAILVGGRSYYAVTYQGRTIAYNLRCFPAAIEACAKHDTTRREQEAK